MVARRVPDSVLSTPVAEWTGHSLAVPHQIYAKVIVGREASAKRRIEAALEIAAGADTGPRIDPEHSDSAGSGETPPDNP